MEVTVLFAPISERYWNKGCTGTFRNNQIRVGGCWFDYNNKWIIKEVKR